LNWFGMGPGISSFLDVKLVGEPGLTLGAPHRQPIATAGPQLLDSGVLRLHRA
jgi:hypothetical protein